MVNWNYYHYEENMSTAIETTSELDTTILEALEWDDTPKCDNDTCDKDATHIIRCHCGVGAEFSCLACINDMQDAAQTNPLAGSILFDAKKSCGHFSLILICTISPL